MMSETSGEINPLHHSLSRLSWENTTVATVPLEVENNDNCTYPKLLEGKCCVVKQICSV